MVISEGEIEEYGIAEVRKRISTMAREVADEPKLFAITHRGKRIMALMPWDMYEAIAETFEILEDEELMGQLRRSIREAKEGRTRPLAELRAELGS